MAEAANPGPRADSESDVILVDHRGAPVRRSSWRTYVVLAQTLRRSASVVGRSVVRRLTPERADRLMQAWCDDIFDVAKVTLRVRGAERLERTRAYVLLSNHVSLLDTPCVIRSFPGVVRFLSKEELRSVPVFGAALERVGIVFVDRKNLTKAIGQLEGVKSAVQCGTSMWIAAEGTRSRDGRLHPFKKGGFHVAVAVGAPIVPVWIQGTLDVIPPDQWGSVTGQTVTVSYGEPIPTAGKTPADLPALMAETRASMLALAKAAGARADVDAASSA